ncbi:hypothetical protein Ciccas_013334, partial [Cichlidogyrus casuarinus]
VQSDLLEQRYADQAFRLDDQPAFAVIPTVAVSTSEPCTRVCLNGTSAPAEMWPVYSGQQDARRSQNETQSNVLLYSQRRVARPVKPPSTSTVDALSDPTRSRGNSRDHFLQRQSSDPSNHRHLAVDVIAEPIGPYQFALGGDNRRELVTEQARGVALTKETSQMSLEQLQSLHQQLIEQHHLLLSQQQGQGRGTDQLMPSDVDDGNILALMQRQKLQRAILQQQAQLAETLSAVGGGGSGPQ